MNQTTFLGLKLPEPSDYYDVEGQANYNSTKIDEYAAALTGDGGIIAQIQSAIAALSTGVRLKGAVDYYTDLPANPSEGDAYTVRYSGTSGTTASGIEYCWATYENTPQWIPIGVDPSVFAKAADLTAETTARTTADTKHNAALVELIDGGAKNRMPTPSGSGVPAGSFDCSCNIPAGEYVLFFSSLASTHATATTCRVAFLQANGTSYAASYIQMPQGSNVSKAFTMTATAKTFRIIPASTVSESTGTQDVVSFSGAMICSKAAWDISQAFVPYCPTMPELYALIQAQT